MDHFYRGYCWQGDCTWSSVALQGRDNATDVLVDHLSQTHGITNFAAEDLGDIEELEG